MSDIGLAGGTAPSTPRRIRRVPRRFRPAAVATVAEPRAGRFTGRPRAVRPAPAAVAAGRPRHPDRLA